MVNKVKGIESKTVAKRLTLFKCLTYTSQVWILELLPMTVQIAVESWKGVRRPIRENTVNTCTEIKDHLQFEDNFGSIIK